MTEQPSDSAFSTSAWRDRGGGTWLAQADRLEAMLAPVLSPLFDHAELSPGEQVLDIGCGRGATTHVAAELVGPSGAVTAVDVSAELIAEAQAVPTANAAEIDWLVADAQRAELGTAIFDAAISRFGVMFFDDAVEAFANIRRAMRPGGRLAIATWRPRDACDFQSVGWQAITTALRAEGYDVARVDPTAGPYAFGVDTVVESVLTGAGWHGTEIHAADLDLYYGGPGASPEDAVDMAMGMTGLQSFLKQYDNRAEALAAQALHDAFSAHHDGTGVRLGASILITTAAATG